MIEPRIEIVLPAEPMAATLRFFREELGLRLQSIIPADNPTTAVLASDDMRVRLCSDYQGAAGRLLITTDADELPANKRAPNGTEICFARAQRPIVTTPPDEQPVLLARAEQEAWIEGRADMLYRDLIPGRLGGHLIASHIRIPDGGPVPDDVHYHDVRCQVIYCYRGWVRVVYEDQGEPFVMRAGDCVVQPPQIRHQVLEASAGLEVVEITSPAEHLTTLVHDLTLPNRDGRPARAFDGQRFHLHQGADASWQTDAASNWQVCDLGVGAATNQLADLEVARASEAARYRHDRLCLLFVLRGSCEIDLAGATATPLGPTDCVTIPRQTDYRIHACESDTQLLRAWL